MAADRTILIKIHLELYSISWEVLEQVFAKFGVIEYIEIFFPEEEFHSKIRFKNQESAIEAFESINHRNVYDRCCQLELFLLSSLNSSSSSNQGGTVSDEIEVSIPPIGSGEQEITKLSHEIADMKQGSGLNFTPLKDITDQDKEVVEELLSESSKISPIAFDREVTLPWESLRASQIIVKVNEARSEPTIGGAMSYSNGEFPYPIVTWIPSIDAFELFAYGNLSKKTGDSEIEVVIESYLSNKISYSFLEIHSALQLLVKMSSRGVDISNSPIQLGSANMVMGHRNWLFDPGGCSSRDCLSGKVIDCRVELPSRVTPLVDRHSEMGGYQVLDPGIGSLGIELSNSNPSINIHVGCFHCLEPTRQALITCPFDRGRVYTISIDGWSENSEIGSGGGVRILDKGKIIILVEMPRRDVELMIGFVFYDCCSDLSSFELQAAGFGNSITWKDNSDVLQEQLDFCKPSIGLKVVVISVFDPGIATRCCEWSMSNSLQGTHGSHFWEVSTYLCFGNSYEVVSIPNAFVSDPKGRVVIFVYDPGGTL